MKPLDLRGIPGCDDNCEDGACWDEVARDIECADRFHEPLEFRSRYDFATRTGYVFGLGDDSVYTTISFFKRIDPAVDIILVYEDAQPRFPAEPDFVYSFEHGEWKVS